MSKKKKYIVIIVLILTIIFTFGALLISIDKNDNNSNEAIALVDAIGDRVLLASAGLDLANPIEISGISKAITDTTEEGIQQLTAPLSPNGYFTAYTSFNNEKMKWELYIYSLETSESRLLKTFEVSGDPPNPIWSYNSQELYITEEDIIDNISSKLVAVNVDNADTRTLVARDDFPNKAEVKFGIEAVRLINDINLIIEVSFTYSSDVEYYMYSLLDHSIVEPFPEGTSALRWPGLQPWIKDAPRVFVGSYPLGYVSIYDFQEQRLLPIPQIEGINSPYTNLSPDGKYILGLRYIMDDEYQPGSDFQPGTVELVLISVDLNNEELILEERVDSFPYFPYPSFWSNDASFIIFSLNQQIYRFEISNRRLQEIDISSFPSPLNRIYGWDPRVN